MKGIHPGEHGGHGETKDLSDPVLPVSPVVKHSNSADENCISAASRLCAIAHGARKA
jgi:hypothetical protein